METQTLIEEIHKRHQVGLKANDPVFVVVTLNEILLSHYQEKFQALLEEQNKLVASEGIERLNQASAMGSEMVNRSLEALSQSLSDSTDQVTNQLMALLDARIQQQALELQKRSYILPWTIFPIVACLFFLLGAAFKNFFP